MRRHYSFEKGSPDVGTLISVGLGAAALGAALTYYLFETESGSEKRRKIKKVAFKIKDKASDKFNTFNDAVKNLGIIGDAGKEVFQEMTDFLKENYDDIKELTKDESEDLADRIRERWEQTRDEIEEMIETAKEETK